MRVRPAIGFLAATWFGLPRLALGVDGVEGIASNPKAEVRGGGDVAVGDSALSQIDNPATLALAPRGVEQLDFAARLAFLVTSWQGPLDSADSEKRNVMGGEAAYALPIDDRLTVGAAFHARLGTGTRFDFRHLLIPYMQRRVGSDMDGGDLEFNAAYRLTKELSVGAGARLDVTTARFSAVLGPGDLDFGRGYAYGGGFSLGLHYKVRDDLALGLAYHSPSWLTDLAGGHGQASFLGLFPVPLGAVSMETPQLPQKIAAGLAWDATHRLKLVGEVRWLNYSNSMFHEFTVAADGLVDLRYPVPLGYRDQWAFMAGGEYKLTERWKIAGGYHYATQAVPAENLIAEGSAIPQHHLTSGLRYERDKWWVGIGYIVAFPETMHGTGWSNIPLGFDYGVSEIRQSQHIISTGFGFRW
jgi:long-subunit fatty acid transport protein